MIPIQAFLLLSAAIFSLGIYCFLASESKFAYLLGLEFCLASVCLVLASGARYCPDQAMLIFGIAVSLYSLAQLSVAAAVFFLPDYNNAATEDKKQRDFISSK